MKSSPLLLLLHSPCALTLFFTLGISGSGCQSEESLVVDSEAENEIVNQNEIKQVTVIVSIPELEPPVELNQLPRYHFETNPKRGKKSTLVMYLVPGEYQLSPMTEALNLLAVWKIEGKPAEMLINISNDLTAKMATSRFIRHKKKPPFFFHMDILRGAINIYPGPTRIVGSKIRPADKKKLFGFFEKITKSCNALSENKSKPCETSETHAENTADSETSLDESPPLSLTQAATNWCANMSKIGNPCNSVPRNSIIHEGLCGDYVMVVSNANPAVYKINAMDKNPAYQCFGRIPKEKDKVAVCRCTTDSLITAKFTWQCVPELAGWTMKSTEEIPSDEGAAPLSP